MLVGGGAVEFYTGGAVMTGDPSTGSGQASVTSPVQPELEEELQKLGPSTACQGRRSGHASSAPAAPANPPAAGSIPTSASASRWSAKADGHTRDEVRVRLVRPADDEPAMRVLSLEDMIADRTGQYASGTARDMLEQSRQLLPLVSKANRDYLDRRIRTETDGDYGVKDLEG